MATTVEFYPENQEAEEMREGDFLLTHGKYPVSWLIRLGQRLRYEKRYARWNHAALVLSKNGRIAEALSMGVVENDISKYQGTDYYLVRLRNVSDEDRRQMMDFAKSVLSAPYRTQYGWLTIVSIILTLLTSSELVIGMVGTAICSGFVAEALVRTGIIFDKPPSHMMPADLAKKYLSAPQAAA
jgi:uncharacterized protein YycO